MEILTYKPINKGFLVGEASVLLPKMGYMVIENIKIFKKENRRWMQFPSRDYEKDGVKKFFPFVRFQDKEFHEKFQKSFFLALDLFDKKQGNSQNFIPREALDNLNNEEF